MRACHLYVSDADVTGHPAELNWSSPGQVAWRHGLYVDGTEGGRLIEGAVS